MSNRDIFELRVRKYYHQLTVGCRNEGCTNKLCQSGATGLRLTPESALMIAVQIATQGKSLFCANIRQDDLDVAVFPLSLNSFKTPPVSASSSPAHSRANSISMFDFITSNRSRTSSASLDNDKATGNVNSSAFSSLLLNGAFRHSRPPSSTHSRSSSVQDFITSCANNQRNSSANKSGVLNLALDKLEFASNEELRGTNLHIDIIAPTPILQSPITYEYFTEACEKYTSELEFNRLAEDDCQKFESSFPESILNLFSSPTALDQSFRSKKGISMIEVDLLEIVNVYLRILAFPKLKNSDLFLNAIEVLHAKILVIAKSNQNENNHKLARILSIVILVKIFSLTCRILCYIFQRTTTHYSSHFVWFSMRQARN